MTVSNRALTVLTDALRRHRNALGTRWRKLSPGRHALLEHKCHGVDVQVIADPAGRLIWASPALPGARHDMGAARQHGIPEALAAAEVQAVADTAYQSAGPAVRVPQRRRRLDPDTGRYRRLSGAQKEVNTAPARQRGPGERANAQLKSWKILRKIRSCPNRATVLVRAVQTLIFAR